MDMQINAAVVKQYREQRAWSQNQLAIVAGLSARTVQRIEATGSGSYDSVQALASAFDCSVEQLRADCRSNIIPRKSPPRRTRWRILGSFTLGSTITLLGIFLFSQVHAEQILMDVSYSIDGSPPKSFTLANDLDKEAEFMVDQRYRVVVIPELLNSGNIRFTLTVFERKGGTDEVISKPKIITANQQMATVIINHQQNNELSVDITPHYGIL